MTRIFSTLSLIAAVGVAGLLSACDDTAPAGLDILSVSEADTMPTLLVAPEIATAQALIPADSALLFAEVSAEIDLASLPPATGELPVPRYLWLSPFLTPDPRAPDKV
ncbi:hypothetical protein [Puniceibacterium sp. IMCC21224]|uniref:hypothetical protein n=1 Tax=Puniceibacterium sp. IMCC21224 TaxID=1618204 RepID=UPI00064D7C75|nr:hypothetical protein [Puniceibacterium sp. IMCC21224]KMK68576.1 hypothetical protein IMCC21224_113459 [Puniceibacterium sp. IMCC21224]